MKGIEGTSARAPRPAGAVRYVPTRESRSSRLPATTALTLLLIGVSVLASAAHAGLNQQVFLSRNNKLYFIVSSTPTGGSYGAQVSSIILSSGTAIPVVETSNNPPDPVVTAFSSFLTGSLLNVPPLANIKRTFIIGGLSQNRIDNVGNPLTGVFDPDANGGNGLLTLPGGARTVTFDGTGTEIVVPVTDTTGMGSSLVPAAATTTLTRRVGTTTFTNVPTIVFPNPPGPPVLSNGSSCAGGSNPGVPCDRVNGPVDVCTGGGMCSNFGGESAGQNVTLDSRLGQRVGNPVSQGAMADGFFVRNNSELIIFLVDHGAPAFGVSVAGFAVTGTCSNAEVACVSDADCTGGGTCTDGLSKRNVVNTTGNVNNNSFNPTPTSTRTQTRTPTATGTATDTATATFTHTATSTHTATATAVNSATSTVTQTATRTHTVTPTPTPSATPTKTPFCGNGIPETPEECDDGNVVNGDCCSATCLYEAPEAPCADDGNVCTDDQCNGSGTCIHPDKPNGMSCTSPVDMCTTGQQCVAGQCTGGQPVVCDDGDACTVDTCDAILGCLFEIGVETMECGSCADGIDNDGDGVIDAENPNCSTFFQLQRFAIIGTATNGLRSLKLGREAKVIEPPTPTPTGGPTPTGTPQAPPLFSIRAGACGVDSKASIGVLVTGSYALMGDSLWSGGLPLIRIGHSMVYSAPNTYTVGQNPPLVGPPSICSNGSTPCTSAFNCPLGQQCEIQLAIDDPLNQWVDSSGTDPEYLRCANTIAAVAPTDRTISALVQTLDRGEIHLRAGRSTTIQLGHGQNVVDIDALRIGQDGGLTLDGFPDTVVVLRIAGRFRIGTRSEVKVTGGIKPENVLWAIGGAGRFARIGSHCSFVGTVLAAKRPKLSIGAFTTVEGSLISKRIRMGRESSVVHYPFTALLQGPAVNSPDLAIRSANLRFSSSQRSTGSLRTVIIVDDSDTGMFKTALLANQVSFTIKDAGTFDAPVVLTGCAQRGDRVYKCRSGNGDTRATIKVLRDDPSIYIVTLRRRHLTAGQTGTVRATEPVVATMHQNMLTRMGDIDSCEPRGDFSLSCRMP